MKKVFLSTVLLAAILSLASCGASRRLGCPSTAKAVGHTKNVNS